jgi:hypothetical protein
MGSAWSSVCGHSGARNAHRLLPMCATYVPISGKPEIGCGEPGIQTASHRSLDSGFAQALLSHKGAGQNQQ